MQRCCNQIDLEVGAGTSHMHRFLRAIGPEPWRAAYVQPSRRPKDGRYGENPNRLQHYYQYQVVLKPRAREYPRPVPGLAGGAGAGPQAERHPVSSRTTRRTATLGALGPGLGSLAQRHGSDPVHLLPAGRRHRLQADHGRDHLRYRTAGDVPQKVENVYDLVWTEWVENSETRRLTYGDVITSRTRWSRSTYNFEHSNTEILFRHLLRARGRGPPADGGDGRNHGRWPEEGFPACAWRCRPMNKCSRRRIRSTCSTPGARSP